MANSGKIIQLKDRDGDYNYPITLTSAVLDGNGGTVEDAINGINLATLETATTSHPAEDNVLKSGINRLFILPFDSKPAGWYRVAKLGITFSGFVTIDGTFYSETPTHATFAISARSQDVASDIIQLSGAVGATITKIRLVSNENGDHVFYLDVYKNNNNNNKNQRVMISGDFSNLENAWTGTAIEVVDTYIVKELEIRSITGQIVTAKGTNTQFIKGDGSLDSTTYATNNSVIHTTGAETATGRKTFNGGITISQNSAIKHIEFTREGANYISVPETGTLMISTIANGANTYFSVSPSKSAIYPGSKDNKVDLGLGTATDLVRWKNLYMSGFISNGTVNLSLPNQSGTIALASDIINPVLSELATDSQNQPQQGDVLKSGINRMFILPLNDKSAGWYRVACLGTNFNGIVYISGNYVGDTQCQASFAISARANDTASDIIQLSGSSGNTISKIRLVSNEQGDHKFYFEVHKTNNTNILNQFITFSGNFYEIDNAYVGTESSVVDEYIRKEFTITNIQQIQNTDISIWNNALQDIKIKVGSSSATSLTKSNNSVTIPYDSSVTSESNNAITSSGVYNELQNYVKFGWPIQNNNSFRDGSRNRFYITKLDNLFYAANKRWVYTLKEFNSTTNEYLYSYENEMSVFDGNYETYPRDHFIDGTYGELYLGACAESELETSNSSMITYNGGRFLLSFYSGWIPPQTPTAQYMLKSDTTWKTATISLLDGEDNIYTITAPSGSYLKALKITFQGATHTSGSNIYGTAPCQLEYMCTRHSITQDAAVTKYAIKQDLWGDLVANNLLIRDENKNELQVATINNIVDEKLVESKYVYSLDNFLLTGQTLTRFTNVAFDKAPIGRALYADQDTTARTFPSEHIRVIPGRTLKIRLLLYKDASDSTITNRFFLYWYPYDKNKNQASAAKTIANAVNIPRSGRIEEFVYRLEIPTSHTPYTNNEITSDGQGIFFVRFRIRSNYKGSGQDATIPTWFCGMYVTYDEEDCLPLSGGNVTGNVGIAGTIDVGSTINGVGITTDQDTTTITAPLSGLILTHNESDGGTAKSTLTLSPGGVSITHTGNGQLTYNNQQLAVLSDIPSIPTNVSSFTNDAGYITNNGNQTILNGTSSFSNMTLLADAKIKWYKDTGASNTQDMLSIGEVIQGTTANEKALISDSSLRIALGKKLYLTGLNGSVEALSSGSGNEVNLGSTNEPTYVKGSDVTIINDSYNISIPKQTGTTALIQNLKSVGFIDCTASGTSRGITYSGYTLAIGNIVSIKFSYAITASTSINIGGTGSKQIRYKGSAMSSGIINAGDIATLVYDGTYYQLLYVQHALVSGTDIKTINNQSIVGSGNITITGGSGSGSGDVVGPSSSSNGNIALFDGTSGKTIKDSGISISDLITSDSLDGYQTELTFDSTPTQNSQNPVTSDGIKQAIGVVSNNLANVTNGTTNINNLSILETGHLKFADYDTGSWVQNNAIGWARVNPDDNTSQKGMVMESDVRLAPGKSLYITDGTNGYETLSYANNYGELFIGDSDINITRFRTSQIKDSSGNEIKACKQIDCTTIFSAAENSNVTNSLVNSIAYALGETYYNTYLYCQETFNIGSYANHAMKFPVKAIRRSHNSIVLSYQYSENVGAINTKYVWLSYESSQWKVSKIIIKNDLS